MNRPALRLGRRLGCIVEMAGKGRVVADIGSDHGLVPLFMCSEGLAARAILTDIAEGPLERSEENLLRHFPGCQNMAEFRLGAGLGPLEEGEADIIIIAGMGGETIAEIIEDDVPKASSATRLVLQPRTMCAQLRKRVTEMGFFITDERLAEENGRIAEMFALSARVKDGDKVQRFTDSVDFIIPPLLFEKRDPLLSDFIEHKILRAETVISGLERAADGGKLLAEWKEHLKTLKERKALL